MTIESLIVFAIVCFILIVAIRKLRRALKDTSAGCIGGCGMTSCAKDCPLNTRKESEATPEAVAPSTQDDTVASKQSDGAKIPDKPSSP